MRRRVGSICSAAFRVRTERYGNGLRELNPANPNVPCRTAATRIYGFGGIGFPNDNPIGH